MNVRQRRWLRGFLKSWTVHSGTYLAVLGYLQTQDKIIDRYLGPDATGLIMVAFGLLVVILRSFKTSETLESKGGR